MTKDAVWSSHDPVQELQQLPVNCWCSLPAARSSAYASWPLQPVVLDVLTRNMILRFSALFTSEEAWKYLRNIFKATCMNEEGTSTIDWGDTFTEMKDFSHFCPQHILASEQHCSLYYTSSSKCIIRADWWMEQEGKVVYNDIIWGCPAYIQPMPQTLYIGTYVPYCPRSLEVLK